MFSFLNRIPPVTKNLLLINVALYLVSMFFKSTGGLDLGSLLGSHYILSPVFEPFQVVTHMFMHSSRSILHIFMNMFLLVMLGSHLERLWGAKHYFIFYFACGLGAFLLTNIVSSIEYNSLVEGMTSLGVNQNSINNAIPNVTWGNYQTYEDEFGKLITTDAQAKAAVDYVNFMLVPGVGASGAIFGLLAAFGILFPNTEFQLIIPPMPVKAKYLIGIYVLYEIYRGLNPTPGDNVAHWAHIGGAIVGAIIVLIRRRTNNSNFY